MSASVKRDFRNLANITELASTTRILNLALVYTASGNDEDYNSKPFFRHPKLNRSILIKHTLRPNEVDLFRQGRRTATKVILPFDTTDLRLGGESLFINQVGFDRYVLSLYAGDTVAMQRDIEVMRQIDLLPSLDPFIIREAMGRRGFTAAPCYLQISASDIASMIAFANEEIARLVSIAFTDTQSVAALRFTGKILSHELDAELDPLKATLRLDNNQFAEGIFSWRGFLYFKWRYLDLKAEMSKVIQALLKYQPSGAIDAELRDFINQARPRLAKRIMAALANVGRILTFYDNAYRQLTEGQSPVPFREFLLEGPKMFYDLGERVGILTHISSFWNYRVGGQRTIRLSAVEYADTLIDFEESLAGVTAEEGPAPMPRP